MKIGAIISSTYLTFDVVVVVAVLFYCCVENSKCFIVLFFRAASVCVTR
jgi:hypothetical protein